MVLPLTTVRLCTMAHEDSICKLWTHLMPHSDRLLLLYGLLLGEGQLVDFDLVQPVRAFQQLVHVYHRLQEHASCLLTIQEA